MAESPHCSRILIVDDSRLQREYSLDALSTLGPEVTIEVCSSGEEAMEALEREQADLVLSDLAMPGMSGLDLLLHVRREFPKTEFILITGHASVETAISALRMGATDYLRKPVQAEELALVVGRTLARRQMIQENTRLHEVLTTIEACRVLVPTVDTSDVYLAALDILTNVLSARRGLAYRMSSDGSTRDALIFHGFKDHEAVELRAALVGKARISPGSYSKIEVSSSGEIHNVFREVDLPLDRVLSVSLAHEEGEIGVLWVAEDEANPFDEYTLEKARIVAGNAELALENAARFSRAREKAFLDDVTELYNARYLNEAIDHELHRAERYGQELSLLFLDVDRFKQVNDRFGHLVGSQVLREVAQSLLGCVRQVDTVARFGGDEFTLLLVDTGLEEALSIAERIRKTVQEGEYSGGEDAKMRISVSMGVSTYPRHGRNREGLLDLADRAMYLAKREGRNRLCSAEDLSR